MTSLSHTAVSHSQLVTRALEFLVERRQSRPDLALAVLLDDAGARFNLSPVDAMTLEHAFQRDAVPPELNKHQG